MDGDTVKKKRFYDLTAKKQIVTFAEEHGNRAAGRYYGIPESNIRAWRKQFANIESQQTTDTVSRRRKSRDFSIFSRLDASWENRLAEELCQYISSLQEGGNPVSVDDTLSKTLDVLLSLNVSRSQLQPDNSWVKDFVNRMKPFLHSKICKCPQVSDEHELKMLKYQSFIMEMRKNNKYSYDQVGSVHQIPLDLDFPHNTEKVATVLLSMTGDGGKLPVFIVFKNDCVLNMTFPDGVIVRESYNGCMTPELMFDWYQNVWFCRPGIHLNERALLALDSSISQLVAHAMLTDGNTDIILVPRSMLPQPLCVQVLSAFKENLRWQCEGCVLQEVKLNSVSPFVLSEWIAAAWENVQKECIIESFKKCYLNTPVYSHQDDVSDDEYIVLDQEGDSAENGHSSSQMASPHRDNRSEELEKEIQTEVQCDDETNKSSNISGDPVVSQENVEPSPVVTPESSFTVKVVIPDAGLNMLVGVLSVPFLKKRTYNESKTTENHNL